MTNHHEDDHVTLEVLLVKVDQLTEMLAATASQSSRDNERIIEQVKITNGRVRTLELSDAKNAGAIAMLRWMVGLGIAIPGSIAAIVTVLQVLNGG